MTDDPEFYVTVSMDAAVIPVSRDAIDEQFERYSHLPEEMNERARRAAAIDVARRECWRALNPITERVTGFQARLNGHDEQTD